MQLSYKHGKSTKVFSCRQVTRLDERTGHQTQILTTRTDLSPAEVAYAMFSRWRQENFFRYLRHNLGLDALDSYAKDQDDLARSVPNPKKKDAPKNVRAAKAALLTAEAEVARETLERGSAGIEGIEQAHQALADAKAAQRAVPARVALGEIYPDAMRLSPERNRLHDTIRMATHRGGPRPVPVCPGGRPRRSARAGGYRPRRVRAAGVHPR